MIPPGAQIRGNLVKKNRRNLLTGMAITLPTIWAKPVVHTVILPAHAATSPDTSEDTGCSTLGCIGEVPEGTPIPIDVEIRADFTVPEGGPIRVTFVTLCNGTVVDGPFSINVTTGFFDVGNIPQNVGCTSGIFSFRATRQDDGCTAECSWPLIDSDP